MTGTGATPGTGGTGTITAPPCETIEGLDVEECGGDSATAQLRKTSMLVVLDKSGSMAATPAGFPMPLWNATRDALTGALDAVKGMASFGLVLFPRQDVSPMCMTGEDCCATESGNMADVPVGFGTTTVPQIIDILNQTQPGGGTPTGAGLQRALEYYTTGDGASLEGDKFVMLVTDGGPNCAAGLACDASTCTTNIDGRCETAGVNCCEGAGLDLRCLDDGGVLAQIQALRSAGIDTFVVGIPGTEAYATYLDQFAVAGGRPNTSGVSQYYRVDAAGGVEGLRAVFDTIASQLVQSCDVQLSRRPPDVSNLNVAVDCNLIPRATYMGSTVPVSGEWDLDQATDPPMVRLLGDLCNFVREQGVQRIDVFFGCPTIF
jgi:hypothetical protein